MPHVAQRRFDQTQVGGVQFGFPCIQQRQRLLRIANLIAEIVGDPAIGVDVVEMLMQMLGQKPGDDREVLVMRVRQPRAVLLRLFQ